MTNPLKKATRLLTDPILRPIKEPFIAAKKLAEKVGDAVKDPLHLRKK